MLLARETNRKFYRQNAGRHHERVEPRQIIQVISEEKVTIVWLLVPWAMDILFAIESGDVKFRNYSLNQWRLMHIGAQPVPPSLIREWRKVSDWISNQNHGYRDSTPISRFVGMNKIAPGFDKEIALTMTLSVDR